MNRGIVVALLSVAAPAAAERRTNGPLAEPPDGIVCTHRGCHKLFKARGDLAVGATIGAVRTWLDLPASESRTSADVAVGFGAYASRNLTISLRGHVQVGRGPTTLTTIGVDLRRARGRAFVGVGPAFGSVRGPGEVDALVAAFDVRIGIAYRSAHVSLDVMPGYAFANDSVSPAADLTWLARIGLSIGCEY